MTVLSLQNYFVLVTALLAHYTRTIRYMSNYQYLDNVRKSRKTISDCNLI